ncbi:FAD-dependent monooxygenase [Streptomyces flavidovirens]|uniref:FAD-dependent monooxygenase n=1 Tax=Streptomyces flavidovirens TaxID=67298 RepID=UPI00342F8E73
MRTQVAVAGAGPVGLLVAAELAGHGVDTVVLEGRSVISLRPKATTLHARAVQCLARRGHLPQPLPGQSRGATAGAFHFAGIQGLLITAPETEPAPILKYPQAGLERLFEDRARAAGVRVLREHWVTAIVQDPDGVRITAEGPEGTVSCSALYLVGADGARSTVREQAGIDSDVHPATVSALTGVVRLRDEGSLAPGWHRTPRGFVVARHDPDGSTHIRTLNCAAAHGGRHLPPSLEELSAEVSWIAGREIVMERARWVSRFSDFTRLSRTFRKGRVFLAGDAAHVHFPIGGQGLSTGVLDALNLGWKLALAVRGRAGSGLLDTYDLERRPAARRVVDNTRAQLALMRPLPEAHSLSAVFGGLLAADRGYLQDLISAQDTVYPGHTGSPSPWEGRFLPNAVLSTEAGETDVIGLLREGGPVLLLFGEEGRRHRAEAGQWAGTLRVVQALPAPGTPSGALLLRPDGYIAWASEGGGPLAAALSAYFAGRAPDEAGRAPADELDGPSGGVHALRFT